MCPERICVFNTTGLEPVSSVRSLATHFAGSQYETRGSFKPPVASKAGYAAACTLSYGE